MTRAHFLFFPALLFATCAQAGVFSLPKYLEPGTNAVGVEPEVVLTKGGGVGANLRYQHGLTDLNNLHLLVGTGTDPRHFRVGSMITFDFVPDVERQPGIGLALSGTYYRYQHDGSYGQLDVAAVPYIHKAFYNGQGSVVEPFVAVPVGPQFRSGDYNWASSVNFGGLFHEEGSKLTFIGEVGVSMNRSETTISGGILFTP